MSFSSEFSHPLEGHIIPGAMLFLPPEFKVRETMASRGSRRLAITHHNGDELSKEDRPYGHPIVILERSREDPDRIFFVCCTSFGGRSLDSKFDQKSKWSEYLRMGNGSPHPLFAAGNPRFKSLSLAAGAHKNTKSGYVKTADAYQMDWRDCEPWMGRGADKNIPARLDDESLSRVVEAVQEATGWQRSYKSASLARQVAFPSMLDTASVLAQEVQLDCPRGIQLSSWKMAGELLAARCMDQGQAQNQGQMGLTWVPGQEFIPASQLTPPSMPPSCSSHYYPDHRVTNPAGGWEWRAPPPVQPAAPSWLHTNWRSTMHAY